MGKEEDNYPKPSQYWDSLGVGDYILLKLAAR